MEVLDEPLYATFLRATGIERPYREELLSQMVCEMKSHEPLYATFLRATCILPHF